MSGHPLLELRGISKRFAGVAALADVDFALRGGEVHGLVGENGAGKSTLMKIIAGVHAEYEGEMLLAGRPVRFRSARDARDAGIGMVHQDSLLINLMMCNVSRGSLLVVWKGLHHGIGGMDWVVRVYFLHYF